MEIMTTILMHNEPNTLIRLSGQAAILTDILNVDLEEINDPKDTRI